MADEFKVHRLNEDGLRKADLLAKVFSEALAEIDIIIGVEPCRERALVVTKLQEASFFAKRALAVKPSNQIEEGK